MDKLWTIIVREYTVRVKSKSFILATLLTPIAIGVLISSSALISIFTKDNDRQVLIFDESNITDHQIEDGNAMFYQFSNSSTYEEAKQAYEDGAFDVLLTIPAFEGDHTQKVPVDFLSKEKLGINSIQELERSIATSIKNQRIKNAHVDLAIIESFDVRVEVDEAENDDSSERNSGKLNTIIGTILGALMGFLMYLVILIYGSMVMRGVMEEKISRIVEVIISSVKPFQLMLGKIIGIGAVGLTQLLFWVILIPIILFIVSKFIDPSLANELSTGIAQPNIPAESLDPNMIAEILAGISQLNWALILPLFILYFIGGYLIYAAIFAAIGSAVGDDLGESQTLMLPIMIPVIIAFLLMQPVLENPTSGLAVFGSLFPLFSPILMPARLAFDPPFWQILLSIVLLIMTVVFMIWISGRIYRIGILLYGKKITLREISKWIFYKG